MHLPQRNVLHKFGVFGVYAHLSQPLPSAVFVEIYFLFFMFFWDMFATRSASWICQGMSWQHLHQPVWLEKCNTHSLSLHKYTKRPSVSRGPAQQPWPGGCLCQ